MSEPRPKDGESPSFDATATHLICQWKHAAPLLGCCVGPNAKYLFASSMDNQVHRWSWPDDSELSATPEKSKDERPSVAYAAHEGWLRGIAFSPDGQFIYTGGYDGKLCFWDAHAEAGASPVAPLRTVAAHDGWIRALQVHPTQPWIITVGNDLKVRVWSTETAQLVNEYSGHEKHVYSLMLHPNGTTLLTGDLKGVIRQWSLETGKEERQFNAELLHTYHGGQQVDYGGVRCIALSPDGQQLASGGLHKATNPFAGVQEPLVVVFNWESGEVVRTHEATEIPRGIVWRLFYAPDGSLVGGIGGDRGYLVFWGNEKTETHKLRLRDTLNDVDRHPNALDLASVHHDGYVRIHRTAATRS